MVKKRAFELAEYLRHMPRGEEDLEAARLLEQMSQLCEVAREVVYAQTHQQSKAAYAELVDMVKGKKDR